MDEGQRFMRYAVPGIAVAIVFALALVMRHPRIICWLLDSATPWRAIALMFGGVIASGGLGFLFAQIYFGLPAWFNTPDHSYDALDKNEKKDLKKVESLCRSFCA
ncbi:MAG: hypothetical protein KAY24_13460, partial [Candidatus Eisenbacteria sp.]|nr:hypothetical protein [Candidatus Eisenbacteria bacterium]